MPQTVSCVLAASANQSLPLRPFFGSLAESAQGSDGRLCGTCFADRTARQKPSPNSSASDRCRRFAAHWQRAVPANSGNLRCHVRRHTVFRGFVMRRSGRQSLLSTSLRTFRRRTARAEAPQDIPRILPAQSAQVAAEGAVRHPHQRPLAHLFCLAEMRTRGWRERRPSTTIESEVPTHEPVHPRETPREDLDAHRMSAEHLARFIDVPANRITETLNGRRAVANDTVLRLGRSAARRMNSGSSSSSSTICAVRGGEAARWQPACRRSTPMTTCLRLADRHHGLFSCAGQHGLSELSFLKPLASGRGR